MNIESKLILMMHEEGRMRFRQHDNSFDFDYMVKDHLGNVRLVLTDEIKKDIYPAVTLEGQLASNSFPNAVNKEKQFYAIDADKIVDQPSSLSTFYENQNEFVPNPNSNSDALANSQKMYKLKASSATGTAFGLGMTLKVMSGDKIDIWGKSYWNELNTGGSGSNITPVVLQFLNGFLGAPAVGAAGGHGTTAGNLNAIPDINNQVYDFLNDDERDNSSFTQRPKAFINYIFFDEQFRYAGGGFSTVNNTPGLKGDDHHTDLQDIEVPKNGYVYIYCSNDSPVEVYFDNLQVVHTRGPLLEETHYYPHGLVMAGISSKAAGSLENVFKYNDATELNSDLDIDTYETQFRGYDPQIGRFNRVDDFADNYHMESPYVYAFNNPVNFNDPLGLEGTPPPNFNTAGELLDFVRRNGTSAFGPGFTRFLFDDDGQTISVSYDPNPKVGKNKRGEEGIWVTFTASLDNGYSEGFGFGVNGMVIIASHFIKADTYLRAWEDYLNYIETNANLQDYWWQGLRKARSAASLASSAIYTNIKIPGWVSKFTGIKGTKGWWLGNNFKYYRLGWGGNGATGARSAAMSSSKVFGVTAKVFGATTIVLSGVEAYQDWKHGNTKAMTVHIADAVMGAVAFIPGVGTILSAGYFISRLWWGD